MKRRKILVLIPALGLLLTGCSFQEGFSTAKHWVGQHIYHPLKDWIDGLMGKKEEPTPEPTPEPGPVDPGLATPVEITEVRAPESIEQDKTLDPASVPLSVKYSDGTTKTHAATDVKLDTSKVAQNVEGTAYYNDLSKPFTINVTEPTPVAEEISPEAAIALCDAAGSGVAVTPLVRVKGVVASGSSLGNNGWSGKFVEKSGEKELTFDSVQTEETYKTLDGATIVIEGYPELYNNVYKVGYLPASASPTEQKFNPTLISAVLPAAKEVKTIDSVEGPTEVFVGAKVEPSEVVLHVTYVDGETGTEIPDSVTLDTSVPAESATLTATLGQLSGTCSVKVVAVKEAYTPAEVIALCDEAGSGVVVKTELSVTGVVTDSSKNSNGWSGKFVEKSGDKQLVFESARTEETYETLDGTTVTIKGYAELYNGSYKVGYLPASASPTGQKYNPTVVSVDTPQVTGIDFKSESYDVAVGGSKDMAKEITFSPVGAQGTVTFTATGNDKVSITEAGVLTVAEGAEGTATVTATCGSYNASCVINVTTTQTEYVSLGKISFDKNTKVAVATGDKSVTYTEGDISILVQQGTSTSAVNVWKADYSSCRWYKSHVVTMTAQENVARAVITFDVSASGYVPVEGDTFGTGITWSYDSPVGTFDLSQNASSIVLTMARQLRVVDVELFKIK